MDFSTPPDRLVFLDDHVLDDHIQQVHGNLRFTALSQAQGHLDDVLDLATVEAVDGKGLEFRFGKLDALGLEENTPDLHPGLLFQLVVVHRHGHTGHERGVDDLDAVRGQEQHAGVVLQEPQEDPDHGVALDVVGRALFEEDIRFVDQQNGIPDGSQFQDVAKLLFQLVGSGAEFADRGHVKRSLQDLGHRFRSQGFAGTRTTMQEEDGTTALTTDKISERGLGGHQGMDQILLLFVHDEKLEGILLELDGAELIDQQFSPHLEAHGVATDHRGHGEEDLIVEFFDLLPVGLTVVRVELDEAFLVDDHPTVGTELVEEEPGFPEHVVRVEHVMWLTNEILVFFSTRGEELDLISQRRMDGKIEHVHLPIVGIDSRIALFHDVLAVVDADGFVADIPQTIP